MQLRKLLRADQDVVAVDIGACQNLADFDPAPDQQAIDDVDEKGGEDRALSGQDRRDQKQAQQAPQDGAAYHHPLAIAPLLGVAHLLDNVFHIALS
jgi:hypothetical protein